MVKQILSITLFALAVSASPFRHEVNTFDEVPDGDWYGYDNVVSRLGKLGAGRLGGLSRLGGGLGGKLGGLGGGKGGGLGGKHSHGLGGGLGGLGGGLGGQGGSGGLSGLLGSLGGTGGGVGVGLDEAPPGGHQHPPKPSVTGDEMPNHDHGQGGGIAAGEIEEQLPGAGSAPKGPPKDPSSPPKGGAPTPGGGLGGKGPGGKGPGLVGKGSVSATPARKEKRQDLGALLSGKGGGGDAGGLAALLGKGGKGGKDGKSGGAPAGGSMAGMSGHAHGS